MTSIQLRKLFDMYARSVASVLSYYSSDKTQVEDWVQEVFVKVWENRDKIDPQHPNIKGYLLRMTRNHALYKLRRKNASHAVGENDLDNIPSSDHTIMESIIERELTQAYRKALERVPPRTREAFILSRDKGLTYNEIAVRMGISPRTVENQISHALKVLRIELHEFRA